MLLTRRNERSAHACGQVCVARRPHESDDADAIEAALRETEEETGIARDLCSCSDFSIVSKRSAVSA